MLGKIGRLPRTGWAGWSALVALSLAGCGAHSLALGGASGATSASPEPASSEAASAGPTGAGSSAEPPYYDGPDTLGQAYGPEGAVRGDGWYQEGRRRWTILAGYPVEQATRRAKAAGFSGTVEVRELGHHVAECELGKVCLVTPARWELDQDRTLTLWVNQTLTITAPE